MTIDFDRIIDRRHSDSSKWNKYPADVLPLWVADMDFRAPDSVVKALRERVEHGIFGYGTEQPAFNRLFCDRLERLYGWRVAPEALVIVPGVIAGFNVAVRSVAAPGDGLLLLTPVYPPIRRVPKNVGLSSDEAELTREASGRYTIDVDRVRAAIGPRTRALLLCNPHNPVGRVFEREELGRVAEICLSRGLVICSDEIHCDLVFSGHAHTPIASLAPDIEARTITFMAPSKTFNLAGLKCSVAIIPDQRLRERFVATQLDLVRAVNTLGYTAMVAGYRDGQPWLDELLRYLEANRDVLVEYVRAHLPGVTLAAPEGLYLAWLDCRGARLPNDDPYTFFLERARVGLNDGRDFGHGGVGFVRLNFACPRATLVEALERMHRALAQHAAGAGAVPTPGGASMRPA
jgi:cysteine-S-conjugate beta-lyase